ncbi:hypothetical protein EYF80_011362 [Liparis tanakae]|uniref:Uncharacterized protein n=1 Tax=Liparis tanakae TaxID=230148 RepID=A0A4Z2IKV6_9TELE|nr:hypothetical protein EYF80_011362 [Liparis tanakae]
MTCPASGLWRRNATVQFSQAAVVSVPPMRRSTVAIRARRPFSADMSASHPPVHPPGNKLIRCVITSGVPGFSSCSLVLPESQPSLMTTLIGCAGAGFSLVVVVMVVMGALITTLRFSEDVTLSLMAAEPAVKKKQFLIWTGPMPHPDISRLQAYPGSGNGMIMANGSTQSKL